MLPRIYADFTGVGTKRDLERLGIDFSEGLALTFYMDDADDQGNPDDIMVDGVVGYSEADKSWVGAVDGGAVYHASESTDSAAKIST